MNKTYFRILIFCFLSACVFKIVDQTKKGNFDIVDISSAGETRINYKIKNELLKNSNKNSDKIRISLESKKSRSIKEKNKKNEVKKYQLNVEVLVQAYRINSESNKKFTIVRSIDYSVSSRHSGTLENEKDALERLTGQISDKILERLFSELNDN